MASSALEEKINKIRQQNEEIRRRYEEVEEDKKNAAKLNALVQMVPSTDWPERKEPPEFSNPPKTKPKSTKEKHEYTIQSHAGEGKKVHSFAQGEGPPPDPKYNFLADSEREEPSAEYPKESSGNRSHHKVTRGNFRKKIGGRDVVQKDNKPNKGSYRDESQPGYDAWRAERNRIDEDRISRQRTAEGNWRREWDNDKVHIIDDGMKKSRPTLDFTKKDYKDSDRRYHANNNEHVNYSRGGGHRPHRGSTKSYYSNYENRSHNTYDQHRNNTTVSTKTPVSPTSEERTVIATEKSIKVTLNQSNATKGAVMSVKVNSPSIAGTGRVGPRQRTRVTYSHSDADAPPPEDESFFRQKSFEDKSKGTYFNNQKFPNLKRSHSQKKKENETKYQHHQKKDSDGNSHKRYENEFRSYTQKDQQKSLSTKSPKLSRGNMKITKLDSSNVNVSQKHETQECSTSDEVKLEQNVEDNMECDIEQNIEHDIEQNIEHDIEQNIEHDIEQNIEHDVQHDIEQNIEQNIEHDVQHDIEQNIEHNVEYDTKLNVENNVEQNIELSIEHDTEQNTEQNIEQNVEHDTEQNIKHNVEYNTELNVENNIEQNIEHDTKQNIEHNVERDTKQNIEHNVERDTKQNIEHNVEHDTEQNMEHNVEQNIEHNVEHDIEEKIVHSVQPNIEHNTELNIEHNIIAETTEKSQITKSEEIEACNEQTNIENESTSEVSSTKDAETGKVSLTSASDLDNPERIAKDETNENTFDNKNKCLGLLANNVTENLQESSITSSEASVPDNVLSNEELVPNESNEVSNSAKLEEALSHEDDQQSSKQITKQFVNDDCDNIKNEVTMQRSTEEVIDNSVSSLDDKTHSVIEINNQSVCNNELVQKEALNAEKETDKNNELPDKNIEDTVNSCEINSGNTFSPVNTDKNLVEENKEETEEAKDGKEEKKNDEDDKILQ